jgi:hypothetical protein
MPTFETIRWIRVILSTLFVVLAIATVSYWQIRDANQIDVKDIAPGCIVRFAPDGTSKVIPFGDPECPQ